MLSCTPNMQLKRSSYCISLHNQIENPHVMSSNMQRKTTTTTSQSEALLKEADVDRNIVTELTSDDVLLGRGVGPNEHIGNVRYRNIVKAHQPEYLATINRSIKDKVAHKAIASVKATGGRFLRRLGKDKAKSLGFHRDVFVVAETKAVLEKTKQALRFQGRNKGEGTSKGTEQQKKNEAMGYEEEEKKNNKEDVYIAGKVLPSTKNASEHRWEEASEHRTTRTQCAFSLPQASSAEQNNRMMEVSVQGISRPRNDHRLFNSASSLTSQSLPRGLPGVAAINLGNDFLLQLQLVEHLRRQREDAHRVHARIPQAPVLELLQNQQISRNSLMGLSTPTLLQQGISRHEALQQLRQGGGLNGPFRIDRCLLPGGLRPGLGLGSPSIAINTDGVGSGNTGMSNALLDQLLSSQHINDLRQSRIVTAELFSTGNEEEKQQGSSTATGQSRQDS